MLRMPWVGVQTMMFCHLIALACVSAQTAPVDSRWSFSLTGSAEHTTRRDESASPLRFGGTGPSLAMQLDRTTAVRRWEFELYGGSILLGSPVTYSDARLSGGTLRVAGLRSLFVWSRIRFEAGVDGRVRYDDLYHRFGLDRFAFGEFSVGGIAPASYRLAMITAGPVLALYGRSRLGSIQFHASAPAVGLVDHPYSDVKVQYGSLHPSLVSVNRLRMFDVRALLTTRDRGRVNLRGGFQASALDYLDQHPVHSLSTSVFGGFVLQRDQ